MEVSFIISQHSKYTSKPFCLFLKICMYSTLQLLFQQSRNTNLNCKLNFYNFMFLSLSQLWLEGYCHRLGGGRAGGRASCGWFVRAIFPQLYITALWNFLCALPVTQTCAWPYYFPPALKKKFKKKNKIFFFFIIVSIIVPCF